MTLERTVRETIERHDLLPAGEVVVLGVSGGADSLAMLHLLHRLAGDYRVALRVGHLNHGLRGADADADAAYVATVSREWRVPCTVAREDVRALAERSGLAVEEAARQARYAFLGRVAAEAGAGVVAVAHTADDQVETVLMHLLRGTGLAGLRGMQPAAWLGALRLSTDADEAVPPADGPRLVRPLLAVWRSDVDAYCREQGLTPRFDLSNLDRTLYRNRLRHALIPYLETYNPRVREVLWRTAEVAAADHAVLRERLLEVWGHYARPGAGGSRVAFPLEGFRNLPLGLQRGLVREAVQRLRRSLRDISWVQVEQAVRLAREGTTGAEATLPRGLALRLDYDQVIVGPADAPLLRGARPRLERSLPLPVPGEVDLSRDWRVRARLLTADELPPGWREGTEPYVAHLDADRVGEPLMLRPRRPGDRIRPLGLGGGQKVSDLMVNARVPRDERDLWPLLVAGDEVLWVTGLRLSETAAVTAATRRVLEVRLEAVVDRERSSAQ